MITGIDIDLSHAGSYDYCMTYEGETLFEDAGFSSVTYCRASSTTLSWRLVRPGDGTGASLSGSHLGPLG